MLIEIFSTYFLMSTFFISKGDSPWDPRTGVVKQELDQQEEQQEEPIKLENKEEKCHEKEKQKSI